MIVLNKETELQNKDKHPYLEMFHKEIDAYCTYKAWMDETNDKLLEMAFEEIMEDEYLHARFLHDYLMDHDMYDPPSDDEYEKKFWKIHKKYFG